MESRYNRVMNKIEVTSEMRDRILNNINQLELNKNSDKVVSFNKYKRYLSIATCFAVLLVGSVAIYNRNNFINNPVEQTMPEIVEYSSANELSAAVGFTVKEIRDVPFEVEQTQYTAFGKELAEIQYTGQNNTALLRMAVLDDNDDISGDYSVYTNAKTIAINDYSVTLKGADNKYSLAVWHYDGVSYAIHFMQAVSEEKMLTSIRSLQ